MRLAQAELAADILPGERNAEVTIAKLIGILENRQVLKAMRHLYPTEDFCFDQTRFLPIRYKRAATGCLGADARIWRCYTFRT